MIVRREDCLIDGVALLADPVSDSLAAFIASGGTALGTELADSKSIVDALGTDGSTPIDDAGGVYGAIGFNDNNNAMATNSVVSNHDGSVFERLEGILQQVNDCNAMAQHAIAAPINDSIAGYIGFDDNNNAADTSNVASNHGGSILERLEGIHLEIHDTNNIDTDVLGTPVTDSLASFIASGGTALGTNLGASASIVDAIGSTGVDLIDSTVGIGGALGYNDNDNAFVSNSVVSNHDGSVFERLEGILQQVNDCNAMAAHALPSAPIAIVPVPATTCLNDKTAEVADRERSPAVVGSPKYRYVPSP